MSPSSYGGAAHVEDSQPADSQLFLKSLCQKLERLAAVWWHYAVDFVFVDSLYKAHCCFKANAILNVMHYARTLAGLPHETTKEINDRGRAAFQYCALSVFYFLRNKLLFRNRRGKSSERLLSRPRLPRGDLVWWGVCDNRVYTL